MFANTVTRLAVIATAAIVGVGALLVGQPSTASHGHRTHEDGVEVTRVSIDVRGRSPLDAYVVRPDHRSHRDRPGVLYLHWFEPGHASADASEFVPEAIELAERGVVSVLPQQRFPWLSDPIGDRRDVSAVRGGVRDARAALDYLARRSGVDDDRLAIVGHDYGGMYGAIVADTDPRVIAAVHLAVDSRWANWFDLFWLGLDGDEEAAYFARFDGLDPIDHVDRLGDAQLFQWAEDDFFVPAAVRDAFAGAAPSAPAITYSGIDHSLDLTAAEADRIEFLTERLDTPN
jgi:dipeptidyl aminopeptidase/acylaminoacyl peptidase